MAEISVEINSSNAAFTEDARGEIARLLRGIAETLEDRPWITDGLLFDANGNRVGKWCSEVLEADADA